MLNRKSTNKSRNKNPNKAYNNQHVYNQKKTLDRVQLLVKSLKGKLDIQQIPTTPWIVTTVKLLIRKTTRELQHLVLSFRRTQEAEDHNSNILAAFNWNLGETLESQKGISLDYWLQFMDSTGRKIIGHHQERLPIWPVSDRVGHQEIRPILYYIKGKPQIFQDHPQCQSLAKGDAQISGEWLGPTPHNQLSLPHQKYRICTAEGCR